MSESTVARRQLLGFVGFSFLCVAAAGVYVYGAARERSRAPAAVPAGTVSPNAAVSLTKLRSEPHVVYRSVRDGEFGRIVVASLADPEGLRFVTDVSCERVHMTRSGGVCLVDNRANVHPLAYALLLDERFGVRYRVDLAGFPSRARMAPDGLYAAATVFTSGDDYEAAFSTRTMLIEHAAGRPLPDLEQYTAVRDGKPWKRIDFNYWGVTFPAASELFFATLRTGDQTFLVRGNRANRELQVVHEGVECPSVSPDGKRIAFKARQSSDEVRIAVLDLESLERRTLLGEERNIDDQVEWLDDEHLLYGVIADRGQPRDAMNVWVARVPAPGFPADPHRSETPRVFLRSASSPAVVR